MPEAPASVLAMITADRASAALGIRLVEAGNDRAITRMTVREDMVNGHEIAHGAFVFAVADLPQNRVGKLSRPDAVRIAAELHAAGAE